MTNFVGSWPDVTESVFFTHIRKKPEKQPTERRYYCIEILKIGNFVVYLMGIIVLI